jgi:hypothetical protein
MAIVPRPIRMVSRFIALPVSAISQFLFMVCLLLFVDYAPDTDSRQHDHQQHQKSVCPLVIAFHFGCKVSANRAKNKDFFSFFTKMEYL